jgi:hypothetical protein
MKNSPSEKLQETKYKAKLFYEQKQEEHIKKFGVPFDTATKTGEVIQEFHDKELENLVLYEFCYNSCIHESSAATMSVHFTKEGAQKSMRKHKAKERKEWKEMYKTKEDQKEFPFGRHEYWFINPIKVQK